MMLGLPVANFSPPSLWEAEGAVFDNLVDDRSGITPKKVWESLNRCHNNSLLRTKRQKKSGRRTDNSNPWKFLKQMEFLIPIKDIRNSKVNLSQEGDEKTGTGTEANILQAAKEEVDILSRDYGVDVPEQAVAVAETSSGRAQGRRKQKEKKVEDNEDLILSLLRTIMERKPESSRMGFFTSIMPRIDTLDDDRFQEFQLQTLQLLKQLYAEQTHQGRFFEGENVPSTI